MNTNQFEPEHLKEINGLQKKLMMKPVIVILICLGVLAFIWRWESKWNLVIGGIAILGIVVSLYMISYYAEEFSKIKGRIRADLNKEEYKESFLEIPPWFKKYVRVPLLFIGFGVWAFASKHENDFGGNRFVMDSVLAGLGLGVIFYFYLKMSKPNLNVNARGELTFYAVILILVLFLGLGPLVNERNSKLVSCQKFKVLDAGSKYLTIHNFKTNKKERFTPNGKILEKLENSDSVGICVHKGQLGYEFVERFY